MSIEKRFQKIEQQVAALQRDAERGIRQNYKVFAAEIKEEISEIFSRYGDEPFLELQKYDRQKKFSKKIRKIVRGNYTGISREIRSSLRKAMRNSFSETVSAMEAEAGKTIRGNLKSETITDRLQDPISGASLNERLQRRRNDAIFRIEEEITQGLRRGESFRDIGLRVTKELEGDRKKTDRIVRTEAHRVQEQGKTEALDFASNQGIVMVKVWVTAEDDRVRGDPRGKYPDSIARHDLMHEKKVKYEEEFYNPKTGGRGPYPGALGTAEDDINCRCTYVVEIVDLKNTA